MPGGEQARQAVEGVLGVVAVVAQLGGAGVQGHAHAQAPMGAGQVAACERALGGQGGGQRGARRRAKAATKLSPAVWKDLPAVGGNGRAQQGVMLGERRLHRGGVAVPSASCCPRCR